MTRENNRKSLFLSTFTEYHTLFSAKRRTMLLLLKTAESMQKVLGRSLMKQEDLEISEAPATPMTSKRPLEEICPVAAKTFETILSPAPTPSKKRRIDPIIYINYIYI